MTSNRSSCNAGVLLRSGLKQQAPLLLVSVISSFLTMPVMMIVFLQDQIASRTIFASEQEFLESLQESLRTQMCVNRLCLIWMIVLAVFSALSIFNYLHSRQQIDFYHSLPISRGKLYAVKFLTGIVAIVPAYLIAFALQCIVVCVYGFGAMLPEIIAIPLLNLTIGFLLIYSISVLCMIVCGNTLVAVLVMFWAHFGAGIAANVGIMLVELFYPTAVITTEMARALEKLVPMAHILNYDGFIVPSVSYSGGNVSSSYYYWQEGPELDVRWFVVAGIVCVIAIVLGWLLSRLRKSESATTAIAFRGLKPPLSVLIHIVLTVGGGVLLSTSYRFSMPLFILGAVIGALLAHCAVEIIYDLDFGGIRNGWKAFGIYAVLAAAVIAGMNVDITGFNTRIPDREDVVGVELKSSSNTRLTAEAFETRYLYNWFDLDVSSEYTSANQFRPLSSEENINSLYQLAGIGVDNGRERTDWYDGDYSNYIVEFTLRNGKTFRRQYNLPNENENVIEEAETLAERMRTSKEYRKTRLAVNLVDSDNVSILATTSMIGTGGGSGEWKKLHEAEDWIQWTNFAHLTKDQEQIQEILNTLKREYEQLTPAYARLHQPVLMMRTMDAGLQKIMQEEEGRDVYDLLSDSYSIYGDMQNIPVYSCFTETIALLEKYCGKGQYTYKAEDVSDVQIQWYNYTEDEEWSEEESCVSVEDEKDIRTLLKYVTEMTMTEFCEVAPKELEECSITFYTGAEEMYLSLMDCDAVRNVLKRYRVE